MTPPLPPSLPAHPRPQSTIRTAVFPCAGFGTRRLPATRAVPKELMPILDRPLVEWAVAEALASGIERFIFVAGPHSETSLRTHFTRNTALEAALLARGGDNNAAAAQAMRAGTLPTERTIWVRQDEPLGLGHAVLQAAPHLAPDEPFAVLLADDFVLSDTPFLAHLAALHRPSSHCIGVEHCPPEALSSYGVLALEAGAAPPLLAARGVVEKPPAGQAPSSWGIFGRYILMPSVIGALALQAPGRGGEIQLTDAIAATLADTPLYGVPLTGRRFDCGAVSGWLGANAAAAAAAGVAF